MFDGSSPPAGGRDGERRILCSDHTKDGGEGIVMFLKDLSTTEKGLPEHPATGSISLLSRVRWVGGYEWLNWQQCQKCHTDCQQGRGRLVEHSPQSSDSVKSEPSVRRSASAKNILA